MSQAWILAGEIIFVADAHRGNGQRFIVRADEKLTAFLEFEWAIRACGGLARQAGEIFPKLRIGGHCAVIPKWESSARDLFPPMDKNQRGVS